MSAYCVHLYIMYMHTLAVYIHTKHGTNCNAKLKNWWFSVPKAVPIQSSQQLEPRRAQLSSRSSPPVKQPAQMWSNKAEFIHSLPIQLMVSMVILIKVHCDFNLPIQLTVRIWSMVILIKFTVSLSLSIAMSLYVLQGLQKQFWEYRE